MRIDKPLCSFKYCKYESDGNCTANRVAEYYCEFKLVSKKQIPVLPENKTRNEYKSLGKNYWCPSCGVLFQEWENPLFRTNYCGNCGQRLETKDKGDGENDAY